MRQARVLIPTALLLLVVTALIGWEVKSTIDGCNGIQGYVPSETLDFEPVGIPEETVEEVETEAETESETTVEAETTVSADSAEEIEAEAVTEVQLIPETETPQNEARIASDDGYRFRENVPLSDELQRYIYGKCQTYGVPESLVYALMESESQFTPTLKSATEDYGICQINKINHERLAAQLGITDWLNPYQNALAGIYMLHESIQLGGNLRCGLMVYNNGIGTAREMWAQGIYTTSYAEELIIIAEKYK